MILDIDLEYKSGHFDEYTLEGELGKIDVSYERDPGWLHMGDVNYAAVDNINIDEFWGKIGALTLIGWRVCGVFFNKIPDVCKGQLSGMHDYMITGLEIRRHNDMGYVCGVGNKVYVYRTDLRLGYNDRVGLKGGWTIVHNSLGDYKVNILRSWIKENVEL